MAKFKPGQKVVCTYADWCDGDDWHNGKLITKTKGPSKNEIVTVVEYDMVFRGVLMMSLKEYDPENSCYPEDCFEPLADISELTEILESQPAEV